MDFLLEALTNWLKEMLVGGIIDVYKRQGVGSERKNSLPRRLPKSCCPDYRSERNFEKSLSSG